MQINAHAVRAAGGRAEPFAYERALERHEVLVRITHCSLARGDVQYMDNEWNDTRFPLVAGHEIVGVIEQVGGDVADLRAGERVGVGYQQAACFACDYCRHGLEQLCPAQRVIAVDCHGGLADRIIVDGRFAFPLPAALDSARAAPLMSSGLTVYAGIVRARLREGARVAVLGAGGLGHLAIQFLQRMGHAVTAFSHSPAKRALIERLGATYADSAAPTGAFDFILSTLNAPFDLDAYVRLLVPDGQLCLVASPTQQLPLSCGLLNNSRRVIYGNYIGSRADCTRMLAFAATHAIAATVDVMPMDRLNDAIDLVRARRVPIGLVLARSL